MLITGMKSYSHSTALNQLQFVMFNIFFCKCFHTAKKERGILISCLNDNDNKIVIFFGNGK